MKKNGKYNGIADFLSLSLVSSAATEEKINVVKAKIRTRRRIKKICLKRCAFDRVGLVEDSGSF